MEKIQKPAQQTESLLAKMLLSAIVYESGNQKEFKKAASEFARALGGEESAKQLLDFSTSTHEALVSACVDMIVFEVLQNESKDLFSKLDPAEKICAENLFFQMTGQSVIQKRSDRWIPFLWKTKEFVKDYQLVSPSKITDEELATVLKAVGAELLKEWILYFKKLI